MILTESYLRSIADRKTFTYQGRQSVINENLRIFDEKDKKYDLFISHSFNDKKLVEVLVQIFNECNYSVYVDWIEDKDLDRTNVSESTASLIKERINNSKSLAYIATNAISESKWCPWELGYSDGRLKGQACILPILKTESSFHGLEYLGLYPYIEYAKVKGKERYDFWIYDAKEKYKYIILSDWLNGKKPYDR